MKRKAVYTTGEVAKIIKVSQQTVIRCFENGSLKGFKVPGSKFRRIPHSFLVEFANEHGIPLNGLGEKRVLFFAPDRDSAISSIKLEAGPWDNIVNDGFSFGQVVKGATLIVIDHKAERLSIIISRIANAEPDARIVVLVPLSDDETQVERAKNLTQTCGVPLQVVRTPADLRQ